MSIIKEFSWKTLALSLAVGVAVSACGSSDNPDNGGSTTGSTTGGTTGGVTGGTTGGVTGGATGGDTGGPLTGFYVSFDGGGEDGTVDAYSADLSTRTQTFNTGLNEGIADRLGTLNAVGLIGGVATLRRFPDFANRGGGAFDPEVDDELMFAELRAPHGIAVGGLTRNALFVADAPTAVTGEDLATVPSLHVLAGLFGLTPLNVLETITVAVAGGRTWDIAYHGARDRLFAAMTNGSVAVYDNFETRALLAGLGGPDVTPSRMITPGMINNGNSVQLSVNLHGIDYDSVNDVLVVSDIGDANSDSDGQIFVIADASTAENAATGTGPGIIVPTRVLSGDNTRLGNPVDLVLRTDGAAYVAEKLNGGGQILVFGGIETGASGNIAPTSRVSTASLGSVGGPESITAIVGQ